MSTPALVPLPAYITARNALAVIGAEWSWVVRQAHTLGVPVIRRGQKRFVPLARFMGALETSENSGGSEDSMTPEQAAAFVRKALGRRRIG